ncbi:hypothetical protein ACFLZG_04480 [Thermodesulfobacteriota bacterium]
MTLGAPSGIMISKYTSMDTGHTCLVNLDGEGKKNLRERYGSS